MKYLSKLSAFLLAVTMVLSGSVVANAEYSDISKAENPDSLKLLSSLGIMNGYTDGTIRPEGQITRAEIAKMIYVIKMGGQDDGAAYYKGVNTKLTDINGHWAEGYIKYCYSTGIIAGRDNNQFDPDANVTGVELAKMLLVVQGYNADKAGFIGSAWANKVVECAAENEYFKGYNTLLNGAATREGAATIMTNALDATIVTWSEDSNAYIKNDNNRDTQKISGKYFGLQKYEGIVTAIDEKEITVNVERIDGEKVTMTSHDFECELDSAEYLGQYVVLTAGEKDIVYGIYASSQKNAVVQTVANQVKLVMDKSGNFEGKVEVNGKQYKLETGSEATKIFVAGSSEALEGTVAEMFSEKGILNGSAVRLIDNDGDGKINLVIVNAIQSVKKVLAVTKTTFTTSEGTFNYDDDLVEASTTFKKGDFVIRTINPITDAKVFTLAPVVEGKVTAVTTETVNGYSLVTLELDNSREIKVYEDDLDSNFVGEGKTTTESFTDANIGETREFIVVNGIAYCSKVVAKSEAVDLALVTEVRTFGANSTTQEAKLLLATGEVITCDIKHDVEVAAAIAALEGKLVQYEVESDGSYVLTVVADAEEEEVPGESAGTDTVDGYKDPIVAEAGYDKEAKLVNGNIVDENAVVFVSYLNENDKKEFTVISGADLLKFGANFGTASTVLIPEGGKAATVIALHADAQMPGEETGKGLAIVTGVPSQVRIDRTTYWRLPVWTLDGAAEIYVTGSTKENNSIDKGVAFTYSFDTTKSFDLAIDVKVLEENGAIIHISGKAVSFEGGATFVTTGDPGEEVTELTPVEGAAVRTLTLSDDVEILNVSTTREKITGIASSELDVAAEDANDVAQVNAYYYVDEDGEIAYIVTDVNGDFQYGETSESETTTTTTEDLDD